MKFEPIETLPGACPLFVEEAYDNLVGKLGVTAWRWHVPRMASELERFLIYGSSRSRRSDFHDMYGAHGYVRFDLFDHAICFKSASGAPFVLAMPYGDNLTFYEAFAGFIAEYYAEKERIARTATTFEHVYEAFGAPCWAGQLDGMQPMFDATIVPDWLKVRKNGDFAAIIAMDHWLQLLSELGGFPLVNADGSER